MSNPECISKDDGIPHEQKSHKNMAHALPMHKDVTRAEAQAKLLKTYFTGKPCKRGHVSERYTSTGACLACEAFRVANYQARQEKVSKALSRAARKATLTGKPNGKGSQLYTPALTKPKVINP